jgi:hypothetical protein
MVVVSEADKVPPACDGNLVGHLHVCSFCLLRLDLTLQPIKVLYEARTGSHMGGSEFRVYSSLQQQTVASPRDQI